MNTETAIQLLQNFGFPIFMVIWFMFRTEKVINKNTEALQHLHETITEAIRR